MSITLYLDKYKYPLINRYILNLQCKGKFNKAKSTSGHNFLLLKSAEDAKTKAIMLVWVIMYFLIDIVILFLTYKWIQLNRFHLKELLNFYGLAIVLALISAFLAFLLPAWHYVWLLCNEIRFSPQKIHIISKNNKNKISSGLIVNIPKVCTLLLGNNGAYTWKDIKTISRNFIDRSQYTITFNDGRKLLLPHWPVKNINQFLACVLKHNPNLAWPMELYLRSIYAGGAV